MVSEVPGSFHGVDWNFSQKYFSLHADFSASVSETITLNVGLFFSCLFPLLLFLSFISRTASHFFSSFQLFLSYLCKMFKVNKLSFCLYSLSSSSLNQAIRSASKISLKKVLWSSHGLPVRMVRSQLKGDEFISCRKQFFHEKLPLQLFFQIKLNYFTKKHDSGLKNVTCSTGMSQTMHSTSMQV